LTGNIYPNPLTTGNQFSIELSDLKNQAYSVSILTADGRRMFKKEFNAEKGKLVVNLEEKPQPGLYLVQIDGVETLKLLVK